MSSIIKIAVCIAATAGCLYVFPVWFPKLLLPAFFIGTTAITWGMALTVAVVGGGLTLKARR